ncbi:Sodium/hydrogen exchanger 7 [Hondaea fermentalgiana]|uniref:Sodium/hydrogen exchanger 7 n=1 Tax=Hondaea fermentalgiana TaxID=2315210 RepID=A0A2R5GP01_9STRA|nr:Sodium/hydrogen exchanger 7 [Hondaea fermentalgiana]|eukprot:GBG32355.1 Sodium/hydrogen exchanger 7 [Hondaea fermentalgiana]
MTTEEKGDFGLSFVVLALAVGVGIKVVQRQFNVKAPYAVLLLVVGFALGILDQYANLGFLSKSIKVWSEMQSRSLLVMFLPPLLFASSSAIDFHVFRRVASQATLLAVPGVFLSAVLTAPIPMFIFPESFDFTGGMLFGSMFAATDPVAVVALLQELGAPPTLSVLIEGESLLNDGIAFALFLLFLGQVTGESSPNVGEMLGEILFMSFFGVAIGVLGGFLCIMTISHIWNEPVLEITVTILTAWGVFLLGDSIDASGVLAVVAFGLTFASQKASHLSSEVHHAMKEVWHMLEFIANTLVFVFSGVVCAKSLVASTNFDGIHILWLFVLYLALNLIRGIMVAVFYVPLLRLGYGFDWKRGLIVSWSGLRGAVGLVAAIEVSETATCAPETETASEEEHLSEACMPAEVKDLILFYMSGIVILTILINGTSTQWLVHKLGVTRRSQTAKKNFDASLQRIKDVVAESIALGRTDTDLSGADWKVVWSYMPVISSSTTSPASIDPMERRDSALDAVEPLAKRSISSQGLFAKTCGPDEVMKEIRFRYLSFVKASYRAQFEDGMCGSWPTLRMLNEAASYAQDEVNQPLNEWDGFLARYCTLHERRWYNMRSHTFKAARAYDIAYSFIKAHEFADEHIHPFAENLGVAHLIAAESAAMMAEAQGTLTQIETAYDDIAASIKTGMAISRTLRHVHEVTAEMYNQAEMDERDFELIDHELSKRTLQVKRALGYVKVRSASEVFRALPLFYEVDEDVVKAVKQNATLRRFQCGELILKRGSRRAGHIYLIIRGQISFSLHRERLRSLTGLERRPSTRSCLQDASNEAAVTSGFALKNKQRRGSAVETSASVTQRLAKAHLASDMVSESPLAIDDLRLPRSPAIAGSPLSGFSSCVAFRLLHEVRANGNLCEPKICSDSVGVDQVKLDTKDIDKDAALQNPGETELRVDVSAPGPGAGANEASLVEKVSYSFGRGELVGELDVFSDHEAGVTEVRCESIVEAFEIPHTWLLKYFAQSEQTSALERNLARHAGLVALESFFPTLRTAPESLRTWVISKLQVVRPPANTRFDPLPGRGGIGVILRGALLATGDRLLPEAMTGVAVFELPTAQQTYAQDSLLVVLPGNATTLLKTSADRGEALYEIQRGEDATERTTPKIERKYSLQRPASRSVQVPLVSPWPQLTAAMGRTIDLEQGEADEVDLDEEEEM